MGQNKNPYDNMLEQLDTAAKLQVCPWKNTLRFAIQKGSLQ